MLRSILLVAAALCVATPALSQTRCSKPYAPVVTLSSKATAKDMAVMRGDVTAFVAAVDLYQACLNRMPNSGVANRLLESSQAEKARVAKEFNANLRAFKNSNPS